MSELGHIAPCAQDSDVAWMLISTVLVLGMFPGLAFFEAGLLRNKTTTTIIAQVMIGMSLLSLMWFVMGYSLTFSRHGNSFIGYFDDALFIATDFNACLPGMSISIPLYALFQLMFACITPLLMTGAFAERMAWVPYILFIALWELFVYYPVAHWMWATDGWLNQMGALDFAGGIVIHTTAGVSSLMTVLFLGKRHEFDKYDGDFPYSSLTTAAIGATLLWTGWFGFNGGSATAANSSAVHAVFNSQIGASVAAITFVAITFWRTRRPSTIAMLNGAIAGLAGVTPAAGYISPPAAMVLGVVLGAAIQPGIHVLKRVWRIDDALDVSILHGLTGVIGSLYIGFAASSTVNSAPMYEGLVVSGSPKLLGIQALAVLTCGTWAAVISTVLLSLIRRIKPLRISEDHESVGLDTALFRERSLRFQREDLRMSFLRADVVANALNDLTDPLRENESFEYVRHQLQRATLAGSVGPEGSGDVPHEVSRTAAYYAEVA